MPLSNVAGREWQRPQVDRRWSEASSSVHSDEFESLESLKWPGFDSAAGVDVEDDEADDVILDDEEEERFGSLPELKESSVERSRENTPGHEEEDGDDPYSPDALSRRADVILANAKRRLNVSLRHRATVSIANEGNRLTRHSSLKATYEALAIPSPSHNLSP